MTRRIDFKLFIVLIMIFQSINLFSFDSKNLSFESHAIEMVQESDDNLFQEFSQALILQKSAQPGLLLNSDLQINLENKVENLSTRQNASDSIKKKNENLSLNSIKNDLLQQDFQEKKRVDNSILETKVIQKPQASPSLVYPKKQSIIEKKNSESHSLDVNDIDQFAETNRTVGETVEEWDALSKNADQRKERTLRSLESQWEESHSEMGDTEPFDQEEWIQDSLSTLAPYFQLLEEYSVTADWTKETQQIIETILRSLNESPEEAKRSLQLLKNQISQLDLFKTILINEEKQAKSAPIGFSISNHSLHNKQKRSISLNPINQKTMIRPVSVEMTLPDNSEKLESSTDIPFLIERYSLSNRLAILDSLKFALDRRLYLWSLAIPYYEAKKKAQLIDSPSFSLSDINQLIKQTIEVRNFFGITPIGQKWRNGFEIDLLIADLERTKLLLSNSNHSAFKPISSLTNSAKAESNSESNKIDSNEKEFRAKDKQSAEPLQLEFHILCDRINSIAYKIRMTPMNAEQKKVFDQEPLKNWFSKLQQFTCDQTDANELLQMFEKYEQTAGGKTGVQLYRLAYRMKSSQSDVCRHLGEGIHLIYDNPNTKFYISELLINRLLPIRDPEFDVVQETVLNNPVAGRRRTDTAVSIKLIPNNERLLMNLNIYGKVIATTSSAVFPATVYNESYAAYFGQKLIEWKDNGLLYSPALVAVNNNNQLSGVQTDIDFVPIIGDIAREVIRGQYESKQGDIERETKQRIMNKAKAQIDLEANERFDIFNDRIQNNIFKKMERLGLALKMQDSKTTDDWILASLRLSSVGSLGSQTVEPATLRGAFADCKIHESTINTILAQMNLDGKTFSVRELIDYLADKLERPEIKEIKVENADLIFGMNEIDPISVRFFEDRVQLRMTLDYIELGNKSWENIVVVVSYRPSVDSNGQIVLCRDGLIQLEGPLGIRAQIPLRSIFSKIFPAEKKISLYPMLLKNDERFTGLTTGLCRITRGWFAISIVLNSGQNID
ncbi:MAG: hypothetical protein Q4C95_08860 [Planctomycetia bacterium]|nr:hypothetical protein [Planctomycetia bacterium]